MPPSYWKEAEWPSPRSSMIEIFSPRVRKAVSRRRSSSVVEVEVERLEDVGVGQEGDGRAGGVVLAELGALLQGTEGVAARVVLAPDVAVAADLDVELFGEGVYDRDADAVQPSGDLVAGALAELAAGVQHREDHFDGGLALLLHVRHGDAAAVVGHGDRVVGVDGDGHLVAEAGQGLVDGVVHDLIDEVVQTENTGRADVHPGALADGLQAFQDGDVLCVVAGGAASWRVLVQVAGLASLRRAVAA